MSELNAKIQALESQSEYKPPLAFALGLRRRRGEHTLDVFFPNIEYGGSEKLACMLMALGDLTPGQNAFFSLTEEMLVALREPLQDMQLSPAQDILLKRLEQPLASAYSLQDVICYVLYEGMQSVQTAEEAYFKLQLISQRQVKPHGVVMDGAFGALTNVAWTNQGPILPEDVETERLQALLKGENLVVSHVDKFPYLVNYHIPSGVRIVSGAQVRLGAYLGEGTTVMPAGYINFNAGTEGHAMVEGRVSAGVMVGNHSDIGGGASIMGTLSGGNKHVISIGERCLLGANAGTGISLGNGCTIAAGLYIYAGKKVSLYNAENQPVNLENQVVEEGQNIVKAMALSGRDYMLFIQDSVSGKVICKPNTKLIELNQELHQN